MSCLTANEVQLGGNYASWCFEPHSSNSAAFCQPLIEPPSSHSFDSAPAAPTGYQLHGFRTGLHQRSCRENRLDEVLACDTNLMSCCGTNGLVSKSFHPLQTKVCSPPTFWFMVQACSTSCQFSGTSAHALSSVFQTTGRL